MRSTVLAAALVLVPGLCLADRKAGDACAAKLPAASREIYTTTLAKKPTPGQARAVVVAEVERLIDAGKLSMAEGRAAGEAAGRCLELIMQ